MKKMHSLLAAAAAVALTACQENRIENVQAEAENQSQRLESRANEITAEAENGVAAAELTLENQAAALLNQAEPTNQANPAEAADSANSAQ